MEEKNKKIKGIVFLLLGMVMVIMAVNGVELLFGTVISTWILSLLFIISGTLKKKY